MMKSMAISEFKAHALKVIDRVSKTMEGVVITKRGRPVAQVIPYKKPQKHAGPGRLSSALVFEKDIVSPLGPDIWEASE